MNTAHTALKRAAACGAQSTGAVWLDSGITLGLVVVDSSRRGFMGELHPASIAGLANALFAPVNTGF